MSKGSIESLDLPSQYRLGVTYDKENHHCMSMRLNKGILGVKDPSSQEFKELTLFYPETDTNLNKAGVPADGQAVGEKLEDVRTSIEVERARIDSLMSATVPSAESELAGIRIGYDGTTYSDAGNAVRDQIKTLLNRIKLLEKDNLALKSKVSELTSLISGNTIGYEEEA